MIELHYKYSGCWVERSVKSIEWIIITLIVVFLGATSTSWAQDQGQRPTCDEGSVGGCINEVLVEQDGLINEVDGLLGEMADSGMFSMGQKQVGLYAQSDDIPIELFDRVESLRSQNSRAKASNDAITDVEYDGMIKHGDKEKAKQGKGCKDSDITFYNSLEGELPAGYSLVETGEGKNKFGNNKCDVFYAEDLDGNPVTVNERKENMCEVACKEKENEKGKSKQRLVEGLRDVKFSVSVARKNLSLQRPQIAALGAQMSKFQASRVNYALSSEDRCADGTAPGPSADLEAILALDITMLALDGISTVGDIVTEILELSRDVGDKTCKQTVGGFNASSVCVPFEVAFHVVKGLNGVVKGTRSILDDSKNIVESSVAIHKSKMDNDSEACRKEIRDNTASLMVDTGILKKSAGDAAAALVRVEEELALMKTLLIENQELLLTPHGQRKRVDSD